MLRIFDKIKKLHRIQVSRCYCTPQRVERLQLHLQKINRDTGHKLNPLANAIVKLQDEARDIRSFSRESKEDAELQELAEKDIQKISLQIEQMSNELLDELVVMSSDPLLESCQEILLELSAGVGGQEAMLFTQELYELYVNYANYKGWDCSTVQYDLTELGGLRHGTILINSTDAYKSLYQEAGVHRVQRVPKTEKAGRIHTSTASISILPTPQSVDIVIPPSDLRIETKRASGAGGQHVNTTESAVRMTHIPSGLSVDCQTERSQIQNRASAFKILLNKLYKMEIEKQDKTSRTSKKLQIGLSERSDKIRTFNFLQDRVTDHRVGISYFNVKVMFGGGDTGGYEFDRFLNEVQEKLRHMNVEQVLDYA